MTTSVQLHRLADELTRLRKGAKSTQAKAAKAAGIDRATLSRLENGRACPQSATLDALLDLYGVTGRRRAQLHALRDDGQSPDWRHPAPVGITEGYAEFIRLESRAQTEKCFETLVVPGLLQAERYTRAHAKAALSDPTQAEINSRVVARMERQRKFFERGTKLVAIMTEAALRYRVGGLGVMRDQLSHLLRLAETRNVTLLVIPQGTDAHPSMSGGFCTLTFRQELETVYFESATEARFLHETGEVAIYTQIFSRLEAVALTPADTKTLIARLLDEMKEEGTR